VSSLLIRYCVLILLGFEINIIYKVFTPLTVYPVYWILHRFYPAFFIEGKTIFIKGIFFDFIPACIAGSAYYLLWVLNLATPMNVSIRLKNLLFLTLSFLIINIARMVTMVVILFYSYAYFSFTHALLWYIGSTVMVVLLWFIGIRKFKINKIPFYDDARNIAKDIKTKKRYNLNENFK